MLLDLLIVRQRVLLADSLASDFTGEGMKFEPDGEALLARHCSIALELAQKGSFREHVIWLNLARMSRSLSSSRITSP
jgi:hypothetical protein